LHDDPPPSRTGVVLRGGLCHFKKSRGTIRYGPVYLLAGGRVGSAMLEAGLRCGRIKRLHGNSQQTHVQSASHPHDLRPIQAGSGGGKGRNGTRREKSALTYGPPPSQTGSNQWFFLPKKSRRARCVTGQYFHQLVLR
jgi:hypothetical protein